MDRLPRTTRLLPILLLWSTASGAADDYRLGSRGEVLDDRVLYTLGGGSAVGAPTSLYRPDGLGVGLTWRANLMCGNMDLQTTLRNQLNGVTEGFQQIMGSVVQNATQAVMSLPALVIQRANPGLYELLSNGVMQGRIDYDRSQLTCQAMARQMAEAIDQGAWGTLAKGQAMQANLQQSQDAVSVVSATETSSGNLGVTWVGGQPAGGSGQPPIRVTRDLVHAGYNLLHSRPAARTFGPTMPRRRPSAHAWVHCQTISSAGRSARSTHQRFLSVVTAPLQHQHFGYLIKDFGPLLDL